MTVKPGDIYAWSRTRPVTVTCLVCTASIVVGVDAHDAGRRLTDHAHTAEVYAAFLTLLAAAIEEG